MDKPWKQHERTVAEFFGTRRALHGIDRDGAGEVETDVFAHFGEWYRSQIEEIGCAPPKWGIVVECKFNSKTATAGNDWMLYGLKEIASEPVFKKKDFLYPMIITRDGWRWIQLKDMLHYTEDFIFDSETDTTVNHIPDRWYIKHVARDMSNFFTSAMDQARAAKVSKEYGMVIRTVCVGSNAHLPKAIGFAPDSIRLNDAS